MFLVGPAILQLQGVCRQTVLSNAQPDVVPESGAEVSVLCLSQGRSTMISEFLI